MLNKSLLSEVRLSIAVFNVPALSISQAASHLYLCTVNGISESYSEPQSRWTTEQTAVWRLCHLSALGCWGQAAGICPQSAGQEVKRKIHHRVVMAKGETGTSWGIASWKDGEGERREETAWVSLTLHTAAGSYTYLQPTLPLEERNLTSEMTCNLT